MSSFLSNPKFEKVSTSDGTTPTNTQLSKGGNNKHKDGTVVSSTMDPLSSSSNSNSSSSHGGGVATTIIARALRWNETTTICDHIPLKDSEQRTIGTRNNNNNNSTTAERQPLSLEVDDDIEKAKMRKNGSSSNNNGLKSDRNDDNDDNNNNDNTNNIDDENDRNNNTKNYDDYDTERTEYDYNDNDSASTDNAMVQLWKDGPYVPSIRRIALTLSLYVNIAITVAKLVAYIQTLSLSVLASLLDSVLDVVSQFVLNYTEQHSSVQKRSSALYPAGASRLEPIGVLTCAALMGMASFEVLKESAIALITQEHTILDTSLRSFWGLVAIVLIKLSLLWLCNKGANKRIIRTAVAATTPSPTTGNTNAVTNTDGGTTDDPDDDPLTPDKSSYVNTTDIVCTSNVLAGATTPLSSRVASSNNMDDTEYDDNESAGINTSNAVIMKTGFTTSFGYDHAAVQLADPTLEALAQDHWNDCLSNLIAAVALLIVHHVPKLWFVDPVGAIIISLYIIYSWYMTGKEQIEQLTGKSAPDDFIDELRELATAFDPSRILIVDVVRAYHFGPKFLVEIEIVMHRDTSLLESHDVGMELQYEIEAREEVERCFVHIDYETRPYDEHVVSKVPALREKYRPSNNQPKSSYRSVSSV